jgi:hypothetical protein
MVTVHGFRSAFRDWVAEQTDCSGEVAEAALADTVSNKVEAPIAGPTFSTSVDFSCAIGQPSVKGTRSIE